MKLNPIVICGRGHSGTRLLAKMAFLNGIDIGNVNYVFDSVDWSDILIAYHNFKHNQPYSKNRDGKIIDWPMFLEMANKLAAGQADCWGWKLGESPFLFEDIKKAFPQAKFVNIIRDGRDVIMSGVWMDFDTKQRLIHQYKDYKGVKAWAGSWIKHVELALQLEVQHPDCFLNIYYEELCRTPDIVIPALRQFLNMFNFCHLGSGRDHRIGKWKTETRKDFLEAFDLMSDTLAKLRTCKKSAMLL